MALQKISATQLFDGFRFRKPDEVLIIKNGIVASIIDIKDAGDDVQHFDGIVCPGYINAHCHLELSYLKNKIPTNTGMVDFILAVLQGRATANEIIMEAIINAEKEMIANGIVAVGDICNTTNTVTQKLHSNIHYTNFIEISGFVPATAAQRFAEGQAIQQQFLQSNLNATIVAHAPYSVSNDLMQLINANNTKIAPTTLHYNESKDEVDFMQKGKGNFIDLYKTLGINISFWQSQIPMHNQHNASILVHNVEATNEDVLLYKNASFCLCANANIYIGNGLPNIDLLIKNDVNICLGTDSLASNTQLCIAAEIKTIQKNFPHIGLEKLLQWATINGAKALGIDAQYGSFAKGKSGKFAVLNF